MSKWRKVAIERLPMLQRKIGGAENYSALWIDLYNALEQAYDNQPQNDDLISALYSYASYCLLSGDMGMSTAVAVCFYEHLPLNAQVRHDVARWLSAEDFEGLENVFSYHLDAEALEQFTAEFYERRREQAKAAAQTVHRQREKHSEWMKHD